MQKELKTHLCITNKIHNMLPA